MRNALQVKQPNWKKRKKHVQKKGWRDVFVWPGTHIFPHGFCFQILNFVFYSTTVYVCTMNFTPKWIYCSLTVFCGDGQHHFDIKSCSVRHNKNVVPCAQGVVKWYVCFVVSFFIVSCCNFSRKIQVLSYLQIRDASCFRCILSRKSLCLTLLLAVRKWNNPEPWTNLGRIKWHSPICSDLLAQKNGSSPWIDVAKL